MANEISRTRVGLVTHLIPRGDLTDAGIIEQLRDAISDCSASGELRVTLDLSAVSVLCSEALDVLLEGNDRLMRMAGALRLINPNSAIRDVFYLTGIDAEIPVGNVGAAAPPTRDLAAPRRRIGEVLLERGVVTEEMIEQSLEIQRSTGRRMAEILVEQGQLPQSELLSALSEQLGVPFIQLRSGLYDPNIATSIPAELARRLGALPLFRVRNVIHLATSDPQSLPALDAVADITGCEATPVLAVSSEIQEAIDTAHSQGNRLAEFLGDLEGNLELVEEQAEDEAAIDEMAGANPVINLINGIILRAVHDGASDIHIEPGRVACRVRLRVDGVLYPFMNPPLDVHPALVSRLKVMARLDIAERRLPQDGRIQVVAQGRTVDLRFSSLPGLFGEKVVLRVLDKNDALLGVDRLGMTSANQATFESLLQRSYGLILVTGPTGSGKTTTLYAALNHLLSDEKNIVTIEDPVEYQIDAINQNQVKDSIGLGFARILKHILRQDPDIIMVGEIRERETAEIAVQAALTGHLVLATLHTNDSIGAVTRMLDMGVEPFLLSSGLIGVMAQRLVRGICPDCRTQFSAPPDTFEPYGVPRADKPFPVYRGRGCASCYDSGYKGRLPIHEVIRTDGDLQKLIVQNPSRDSLDEYIRENELSTLVNDGVDRVIGGKTTLEEVLRAVNT